MKLNEVVRLLDARILNSDIYKDFDVLYAFSGDLMSDVLMLLKLAPQKFFLNGVLLTGNTSLQSVRTAELLDFHLIIFTRDKLPTQQVIDYATSKNIILLATKNVLFSSSGLLYKNDVLGYSDLKNGTI
jgi:hypothetical protein